MSRATSLQSMAQQLAMSIGVGTGALALHVTRMVGQGAALTPGDFVPAFVTVGLISLSCLFFFFNLSPDAGSEVSGHRAPVMAGTPGGVGTEGPAD